MRKYHFQSGGTADENTAFFSSLVQQYQDQADQGPQYQQDDFTPNENYDTQDNPQDNEDDYNTLLDKYNQLQEEHNRVLQTQSDVTAITQPEESDDFLNFLFSGTKKNMPIDFDQIDFNEEERLPAPTSKFTGINPLVKSTEKDLFSQYNLTSKGIWGDEAHQKRKSDHNTGDAEDFGFDTKETATEVVQKLQQEASQRGVKYIIYDKKIWNPSVSDSWRPYKGSNPHTDHIHVSYNKKQTGGYASTPQQQYMGLNNPNYDEMTFPLEGYNTFRGLDNNQPVHLQDQLGKKYILNNNKETVKAFGIVKEKRI